MKSSELLDHQGKRRIFLKDCFILTEEHVYNVSESNKKTVSQTIKRAQTAEGESAGLQTILS